MEIQYRCTEIGSKLVNWGQETIFYFYTFRKPPHPIPLPRRGEGASALQPPRHCMAPSIGGELYSKSTTKKPSFRGLR